MSGKVFPMYNRNFPLPASKIIQRFRVSPVMTTSIPLHGLCFFFRPAAGRRNRNKRSVLFAFVTRGSDWLAFAQSSGCADRLEPDCNLVSIHYLCFFIKCLILNRLYIDTRRSLHPSQSAEHSISCLPALFKLRYSPKYMPKMRNRY